VRSVRESKGLSPTELAKRIGSTQPTIWRIESEKNKPDGDTIGKLADALGVSTEDFYDHLPDHLPDSTPSDGGNG